MDVDTSVNEMLHKLIKVMYRRTNEHGQAFTLQLMRAELTLAYAIYEHADKELLRKAGLLGPDGALLDHSRQGQAARERAIMDGEAAAAALRLRRGPGPAKAELVNGEGACEAPG